jgi:hypothetical protein
MKRLITAFFLTMALITQVIHAQDTFDAPDPIANLRNTQYFSESVRLTNLAQLSFEEGDYDLSTWYSSEAIRYAQLSDEYVALQLRIKEVNDAIKAARTRLDWANSPEINARSRFPAEISNAQTAYNEALAYRRNSEWDNAIDAAMRVFAALAFVTEPEPSPAEPLEYPLPAQYTVHLWNLTRDCLWNIAGRPYVYNDPYQWRLLYNANKSKLPEPNNPDLIEPEMILDIPSFKDEPRSGLYDPNRTYTTLP